jgi:hypothetical protein
VDHADRRREEREQEAHRHRRREERRVQGDEGRGQDPAYDPEHPEAPGDTSTAR